MRIILRQVHLKCNQFFMGNVFFLIITAKNQVITEALPAKILNYLDNKLILHIIQVYSVRV